MCSIITIKKDTLKKGRLEKYLAKETMFNDDGMSVLIQDKKGRLSSLRTFDLDAVLTLLELTEWDRMWMHMRAATQGEVNIRNTHGWMTTSGTAVMHNGILYDKDSWKFNVDSELIVDWIEQLGMKYALEMLQDENYANVFIIENLGNYYVSRSKSGTLFTDGQGNYATNQVGRINKPVKTNSCRYFESGFKLNLPSVRDIVNFEDEQYFRDRYGYGMYGYDNRSSRARYSVGSDGTVRNYYGSSYYGSPANLPSRPAALPSPADALLPRELKDDNTRFNDSGETEPKPNSESVLTEDDEDYQRAKEEIISAWDTVHDRDSVSDEDFRTYLDEGRLIEFEQYKKKKVS